MKREETNDLEKIGTVRRSRMTTKVMIGFMRVICVILCLIISTTAYAESILWETKHSSTSLDKDQEWLADALLAEELDANPPAEDEEAAPLEITMDDPEINPQEEAEGMEPQDIPKAGEDTLAEPLKEDIHAYLLFKEVLQQRLHSLFDQKIHC